jgi:membrane protein YqaA with SNARE-associated domain
MSFYWLADINLSVGMPIAELVAEFTAWAEGTAGAYGYAGIFLVSLIGNLSIIFPVPSIALVFAMGAVLNPWLVGLAGGAGSALGELSGYAIGRGGRKVAKKKYRENLRKARKWVNKRRRWVFLIIFLFAATPLPSDIIGILAGVMRYDIRKFLLANFAGKLVMNTYVAFGGYYALETALALFGGI